MRAELGRRGPPGVSGMGVGVPGAPRSRLLRWAQPTALHEPGVSARPWGFRPLLVPSQGKNKEKGEVVAWGARAVWFGAKDGEFGGSVTPSPAVGGVPAPRGRWVYARVCVCPVIPMARRM